MWKQTWIFRPSKLHQKNYVETSWIFWPTKLHIKKYMKTTWIFQPSKFYLKKYVETMWIFRPSILRKCVDFLISEITLKKNPGNDVNFSISKIMWKWRGNLSKFGIQCVDVISISNRFYIDVKSTSMQWGVPIGHRHKSLLNQSIAIFYHHLSLRWSYWFL